MKTCEILVEPLTPGIGAEVWGLELAGNLTAADAARLEQALLDHHVLYFRDQTLDPPAIKRFAGVFGPLAPHPRGDADCPEVMPFRSKQSPDYQLGTEWHTDMSYTAHPPIASLLYFSEAPAAGAELGYTDMHAVFDALSDRMKAYLSGLSARHEAAFSRFGSDRNRDDSFVHPLVGRHAATGRPLLYFNSVYTTAIEGVPAQEGRAILDFLRHHSANPYFQLRIRVEPSSLVIWDNRCTQHLALWNFQPGALAGLRSQVESVAT